MYTNCTMNGTPKILLVDDREDNLLSMEAILKKDGYQFTTAYSGSEALKILNKDFDFAMILMDVKMPILSGFETASLIYERETLKQIPIIFITANYYGEENLFKGYQSGGIDYIFKPINPEVLRAKVAIFIELYRKNRLLIEQDQKLLEINKNLAEEIKVLRKSELKLKVTNHNLRKKISDLETLMSLAKIPVEASEFVESDLNVLLKGLLSDMKDEVNSAVISVGQLPSLYISPRLMGPVFKNLIRNTLLHQEKNISPIIRIRHEISGDGNNRANIHQESHRFCNIFVEDHYVEDHHNGFEQIAQPQIKNEFCDTELGLAFCKKILEHHKGTIYTTSTGNEGLTYVISLPVHEIRNN